MKMLRIKNPGQKNETEKPQEEIKEEKDEAESGEPKNKK